MQILEIKTEGQDLISSLNTLSSFYDDDDDDDDEGYSTDGEGMSDDDESYGDDSDGGSCTSNHGDSQPATSEASPQAAMGSATEAATASTGSATAATGTMVSASAGASSSAVAISPAAAVISAACARCVEVTRKLDMERDELLRDLAALELEGEGGEAGKRQVAPDGVPTGNRPDESHGTGHGPAPTPPPLPVDGHVMMAEQSSSRGGHQGESRGSHQRRSASELRSFLRQNHSARVEEVIRCMEAVHFSRPAERMATAWLLMYPRCVG